MRLIFLSFIIMALTGLGSCSRAGRVDLSVLFPPGPVHTVTAEPGVVPAGTPLVVLTTDRVDTTRAFRSTIYDASVAEDILDQNENVLIAAKSPVELVVRLQSFLGPGGVGMTELMLEVQAVTVNGVRYPVETEKGKLNAGGIGVDRDAPKFVGGEAAGQVVTSGCRISVPVETLLAFEIEDPIRLKGYRR